jgi:radical SAM protein with 4Fe4S-binding SPASM domain
MDKYKIDSQKISYFPARIGRWQEDQDDWEKLKKIYPIYMEVSPSGGCNHRCIFCALDFLDYEPRFLNIDGYFDFLETASQKEIKSIMFSGEGEPLLHPQISEMVIQTKQKGIDTAFTTNGSLMTPEFLDTSLEYINWIKISLDAATPETHAVVHGTKAEDYHRIIENITYAVKLKEKHNYACSIGVQILLLPENRHEVLTLAKDVKDLGVEYFVVKPYSQGLYSKNKLTIDYNKLDFLESEIARLSNDNFSAVFRTNAFSTAVANKHIYKQCHAVPFFWAYMMSNGDIYSCSAFLGNDDFLLGNINKERFDQIWESEKRKKNWELLKRMSIEMCRENCRMDKVNVYLEELLNPPLNRSFI